jgi:hypothetical protein
MAPSLFLDWMFPRKCSLGRGLTRQTPPSNTGLRISRIWSCRRPRKTWPVNRYSIEGERRTDWLVRGVLKYHRTVATTLNTLLGAGFTIRHVEEFAPTAEQMTRNPELAEEVERPMLLLVSVQG